MASHFTHIPIKFVVYLIAQFHVLCFKFFALFQMPLPITARLKHCVSLNPRNSVLSSGIKSRTIELYLATVPCGYDVTLRKTVLFCLAFEPRKFFLQAFPLLTVADVIHIRDVYYLFFHLTTRRSLDRKVTGWTRDHLSLVYVMLGTKWSRLI